MNDQVTFEEFQKFDIRVGKIIEVNNFPKANKPAYKLKIDFGEDIGYKNSSAQITDLYSKNDLNNKIVIAVTNFPPLQIADFISEVLVLGIYSNDGVVLLSPDQDVNIGEKIG